jgi:hypothetical protein
MAKLKRRGIVFGFSLDDPVIAAYFDPVSRIRRFSTEEVV